MLMAAIMWLLGTMGVAPSEDDFLRYDQSFRERGHHATLDFGGMRIGGTRWTDDDWEKNITVGLGYEFLIDRTYNGVGFEVLTQSLGKVFDLDGGDNFFFVGGGLAWYPIRHVRIFMQAGTYLFPKNYTGFYSDLDRVAEPVGRVGLGYRFMFFMVGMQPYFVVEKTASGQFGWGINFRFEFP